MKAPAAALAQAWLDAINAHEPGAVRALLADDFTWALGDASTRGADVSAEAWRDWFAAFPDFSFVCERLLADGECAVVQLRMRGTHRGPLKFRGTRSEQSPLRPTGLPFDLPGCAVHEVRGGRIARLHAYWDTAALLRQIGATAPRSDF